MRCFHPILLTALLLLSLPLASQELGSEPRAAIEACHALDDRGNPDARDCYLALLSTQIDDGVRAEAYWRLNDVNRANAAFRRAVEADPG